MAILVLNAGSSSLKCAVFDGETRLIAGRVEEIRSAPRVKIGARDETLSGPIDHATALGALLSAIDAPIDAVGHRVVHGGDVFTEPTILDAETITRLDPLSALAPLHNPPSLAVIAAAAKALPRAAQAACFDTAFHAGQPAAARRFALPSDVRTEGLVRYGFHGLSYQGLVDALDPTPQRLLACHLGAGASLCAIVGGRSVATTMGWSPLDGLTMATRSGSIDPAAALELARRLGVDAAEALLNRESGLLGLSALSGDMRALEASDTAEAAFAIEHFLYWIVRHAGSMIAAMDGIDTIAFTGGVGENAAGVREAVCARLAWTGLAVEPGAAPRADGGFHAAGSAIAARVVNCDEEAVISRAVRALFS